MDRCPLCNRRMKTVLGSTGRTEFQCLDCDKVDPMKTDAVKWAESPLAAPVKADVSRLQRSLPGGVLGNSAGPSPQKKRPAEAGRFINR